MPLFAPIDNIAHNIQLAVAPVFLLTAIGTILNVLTTRLGRVVDRGRRLENEIPGYPSARRDIAIAELSVLNRRMSAANLAILLCTLSALLVCVTIAILFLGELTPMRWNGIVAVLFIIAMALLIAGLMLFLFEVQVALRAVRLRAESLGAE